MFYSVDRIEGPTAVLVGDDEKQYDLPLSLLPEGVREGDILRRVGEAYTADPEETARRKRRIQALLDRLPGRD